MSLAYYDEKMIENMRQEQFIINEVNRAIEEEQFEVKGAISVLLPHEAFCQVLF